MTSICRSSFYHLRNLSRIRKYFTKESAEVAVHAFVTSKLDYCNPLLYGLPKYQLQRLQYVQNTAARVVLQVSKFQHITPVLCELHWLPIQYRIIFKILLVVYKSLNGTSPSYLAQKLHYRPHSRSLRSVSNELLMQPRRRRCAEDVKEMTQKGVMHLHSCCHLQIKLFHSIWHQFPLIQF